MSERNGYGHAEPPTRPPGAGRRPATPAPADIRRVAVVDDDPEQAEYVEMLIERAGLETIALVEGPFGRVEDLRARVYAERADAVVCDHRLKPRGLADFTGAAAVADLHRHGTPAVLLTQFTESDTLLIRKYREWLPGVLARDDADAARLHAALDDARHELAGDVPPRRRPYRAMLDIVEVTDGPGETVIDVLIPQWRAHTVVPLPASLVPDEMREELQVGRYLYADVNINAEDPLELFFTNFALGPDRRPVASARRA
jgi:CheY-like chemotaxis protein